MDARPIQFSRGDVAQHLHARLARSRDIVNVVVAALQEDPLLFLHPQGECSECDEAGATVPY